MVDPDSDHDKGPSLWQVAGSVLSAALGVQNSKNRERDFQHGKPLIFILMGLFFTFIFIGVLILLVHLVLP